MLPLAFSLPKKMINSVYDPQINDIFLFEPKEKIFIDSISEVLLALIKSLYYNKTSRHISFYRI